METKLHRIRSGAMLGGVCSGLAKYFNLDVTIVRLVFILLAVVSIGVLLYLILWFLLPAEEKVAEYGSGYSSEDMSDRARVFGGEIRDVFIRRRENTMQLVGIGLVILGVFALLRIFMPVVFDWVDRITGPLLLMLVGGVLLFMALKGGRK